MSKFLNLDRESKAQRQLQKRSVFLFLLVSLLGIVTLFQIVKLTILDSILYTTLSDENRIISVPIYPSRGLIKLSNDEIVVENIVSQALTMVPAKTLDIEKTLRELRVDLVIDEEQLLAFEERIINKPSRYERVVIVENLSPEQIAKFSVEKDKWPGLSIEARLMRFNLLGHLFSHVLGYVGQINPEEIEDSEDFSYPLSFLIGKTGVEKFYEEDMRGGVGYKTIEVDVNGKEIRELDRVVPNKGSDVYLSLDKELQKLARKELAGRKGAVVALNPNTGFIKALVSSPDFNPNILNKTESGDIETIFNDLDSPLFNRAISGNYPPASTIKPFIGLLGLKEGEIDWNTTIEDEGFFQLNEDGRKYRGWKEDGHGKVNLSKSIIVSSDVFFYQLAAQLTVDRIAAFLKQFGFGLKTGVDLYAEGEGILPDRKWKLGAIGESWFVGDTLNIGIGQGYISCTPLQLAVAISSIATRGKIYKPKVVAKIGEEHIEKELIFEISSINQTDWSKLENSMVSVISDWRGTAYNLAEIAENKIAGKTGTAQIKSLTDEELTVREEYEDVRQEVSNRDHALFVGYGPIPEPELTVVVIVENGESGSAVAAPIAQKLIDNYLRRKKLNVR
jgi:penicillin-binding protein 2